VADLDRPDILVSGGDDIGITKAASFTIDQVVEKL
jgi:hypothetical protein